MATVHDVPEQPQEQRPHVVPVQQRRPRYGQPFFPVVPFGSAMYITATVIALVVLSLLHKADLQNPADPLNHARFNPRPEWYFLFLFQILKYFQGPWELVGTAVIPGIVTVLLIGLPFYDRNWSRRASRRPVAMTVMAIVLVLLAYLTYKPISDTAALNAASSSLPTAEVAHPTYTQINAIFTKYCAQCHIAANLGGLSLGSYASVMKGGTGGGPVAGAVVKPGNPDGSYLYQVVARKQKVGAGMPFGQPPIPAYLQKTIYNWIKDGAKNK